MILTVIKNFIFYIYRLCLDMKHFVNLFCKILKELGRIINALCDDIWIRYLRKDIGPILQIYNLIISETSPTSRAIVLSVLVLVEHAWQQHMVSKLF